MDSNILRCTEIACDTLRGAETSILAVLFSSACCRIATVRDAFHKHSLLMVEMTGYCSRDACCITTETPCSFLFNAFNRL